MAALRAQIIQDKIKLKNDFPFYADKCLKICTKEGDVKPFILNKAQLYIHQQLENQKRQIGKVRAVILKARQMGISSYVAGRYYHITTHSRGCQCFILTNSLKTTNSLYKMAQRFYEHTPLLARPEVKTNNSKELNFGLLDSGYKIGTAETKTEGRGTTIQLSHNSECAFWNNAGEIFKGLLQAVPDVNGTEIIFESTANGIGNFFHQMYQKAESGLSDYIPIFVPWHWQNEYKRESQDDLKETEKELFLQQAYSLTKEQLAWRRNKIIELSIDGQDGEKVFSVEYPSDAAEAFQLSGEDTFISPELVMRARKTKCEPYGPKICGVDVARFGEDRTCIVIRQGRVVLYLKTFKKIDNMEIVGILVQLIEEYKLSKVFIDLGGGSGIIDRLNELGNRDIVVGVNFGSKPFNHERFLNKRSEMFGLFRDWLEDAPVQLIDSNELQGDLCNIKYSYDSNSRLVMEPKEKMKARGLRSCDLADALILTFSMPPSAYDIMHKSNNIVKSLAGDFREKMNVINKARQEVKSNSW